MKIVLAYSGGLDTSVLLSWIKQKYQAEMIAFCANIGQEEELKGLDKKARQTGASKVYIDDLQDEFARDFKCGKDEVKVIGEKGAAVNLAKP